MTTTDDLQKRAGDYADNLYRKSGVVPNQDGRWWMHKDDFIAGALSQDPISRKDERRLIKEQLLWDILNSDMKECETFFDFIKDYFESRQLEAGEIK